MPPFTVPKDQTALLVMDCQNDIVHPDGKIGRGGAAQQVREGKVLEHIARLIQDARAARVPIIYIRVAFRPDYADLLSGSPRFQQLREIGALQEGSWGAEIHPAVAPAPEDLVITKHCVNPFYGTALGAILLRRGVRCVVLCGVATNFVVESTARYAADAGYQVVVVREGCASFSAEFHQWSLDKVLPAFGAVVGVKEAAAAIRAR